MSQASCQDCKELPPPPPPPAAEAAATAAAAEAAQEQHQLPPPLAAAAGPACTPGAPCTPSPTPPSTSEPSTSRLTTQQHLQQLVPHGAAASQAARQLALGILNHGVSACNQALHLAVTHLVDTAQWLWLLLHTHRRHFTSMPECMLLALRDLLRRFLQLGAVQQVLAVTKQLAHVRVTMSSDNELSDQVKFSGQLVTNLSALFGMVRVRNYSSVVLAAPTLSPPPQPELAGPSPTPGPPSPRRYPRSLPPPGALVSSSSGGASLLAASSEEVHLLCSLELKRAILGFLRQQTAAHGQAFVLLPGGGVGLAAEGSQQEQSSAQQQEAAAAAATAAGGGNRELEGQQAMGATAELAAGAGAGGSSSPSTVAGGPSPSGGSGAGGGGGGGGAAAGGPLMPAWARHLDNAMSSSRGDASKVNARSFFSPDLPPSLAASAAAAAAAGQGGGGGGGVPGAGDATTAAAAAAGGGAGSPTPPAPGAAAWGMLPQFRHSFPATRRPSLEVFLSPAAAAAAGGGSGTPPRPPSLASPGGHLVAPGGRSPHQLAPLAASSPVFAAPAIPVSPAGLSQLLEGMQPGGRVSPIGYPARHGISLRRRGGVGPAVSGGGGTSSGSVLTASLPELGPLRGALFGNIHAARTSATSSSIGSGLGAGAGSGGVGGSGSSAVNGLAMGWKQGLMGAELMGGTHQVPLGGSGASTPVLLQGGESPAR